LLLVILVLILLLLLLVVASATTTSSATSSSATISIEVIEALQYHTGGWRRRGGFLAEFLPLKIYNDDNNKHNVAVDSNEQRCRDGDVDCFVFTHGVSFFPRLFKLTMMDDVMIDRICGVLQAFA
jgi:hypothetical protein